MSFFLTYSAEDYEYILTPAGYIALAVILIAVFLSVIASGRKKDVRTNTKQLVFCAASMALAMVASYIKFASLPFGGSITLFSMLFISLVGYLYGPSVGITTGIAYGILQLITGPYIYHPVQVLLDYPLAFGMLGLSGFFSDKKHGLTVGYTLGVFGRYICHVLSGYIFFAGFAPEGMNPFIYTIGYNATYIVPELIATCVILSIPAVLKGLGRVKAMANS